MFAVIPNIICAIHPCWLCLELVLDYLTPEEGMSASQMPVVDSCEL